jgi:hypothetical protein
MRLCGVEPLFGDFQMSGVSGVNEPLLSRPIVSRPIVSRPVVALGVVVSVAGWGVPRLVAMLVGVILGVILGVISIMPSIAAIAAGESDGCHHH